MTISVIIPAYNAAHYLRRCLQHLAASTILPAEIIVVDDGSTDDTIAVARSFGAKVATTPQRSGPARARNLGTREATGELLFFIDADVCVYPDALSRIIASFDEDPEIDALIGSYDSSPDRQDFLSQYRNLMHCYTHQHGGTQACTFWSGCGVIRKSIFVEHSGFDEGYRRPAIEDIELGYRLKASGKKIVLDPNLQVKHLKAWSFMGLVKTDIVDRGIPWTELILRDKCMPNDLNVQLSQRVSVALAFILLAVAAAGAIYMRTAFILPLLALLFLLLGAYEAEMTWKENPKASMATFILGTVIVLLAVNLKEYWLAPPVLLAYGLLFLRHRYAYVGEWRRRVTGLFCGVFLLFVILIVLIYLPRHPIVFLFFMVLCILIALNSQFYVFLAGRTGRLLALAAIPFHLLFHFYNGVSFLIGLLRHTLRKARGTSGEKRPVASSTHG